MLRTPRTGAPAPAAGSDAGGRGGWGGGWPGAVSLAALMGVSLLAFYVVVYPLGGYRLALGSDTPVYVWWARFAGADGLSVLGTEGRPAIVGLLATVAGATGTQLEVVAEAVGPALAATLGLAAGGLAIIALGPDRIRFALSTLLTGTFLGALVAGYFSTIAFGALFLAALSLLVAAVGRGPAGRRPGSATAGAAVLLGAAGLVHPLFLLLAGGVLAGSVLALVPAWRRDAAGGLPWPRRGVGLISFASIGGAAITGAGVAILAAGTAAAASLDTSRDSALRRVGLGELVTQSFRRKLIHDFPIHRAATVLGLGLVPFLVGRHRVAVDRARALERPFDGPASRPRIPDGERAFWGAVLAWLGVTAVGVAGLAAGAAWPGQRLAAFCLPLPLLAAIGLHRLGTRNPPSRRRRGVAVIAVGAGVFMAVASLEWAEQTALVSPAALAQSRVVGAALGTRPPGTPLIVVLDPPGPKPGLRAIRFTNYVRAGVPPGRVPDVHYYLGSVANLQAGRPTLVGDPEHDRLSAGSWDTVRGLLGRSPVAVAMRAFDRAAYDLVAGLPEVRESPGRFLLGPGVATVPGFEGQGPDPPGVPILPPEMTEAGAGPISPWMPLAMGPVVLVLLAGVGAPWSWLALGDHPALSRAALAPAFGTAAVGLSSVAVDAAGLRLSGVGGAASMAVAVGVGLGAVILTGRRGRRRGPAPRRPGKEARPEEL